MSRSVENLARTRTHLLANLARKIWETLTDGTVGRTAMYRLGRLLCGYYTRHTAKIQNHYAQFMRMPPLLEMLADLIRKYPSSGEVRIACFGCRAGVELYSALYVLRTARPDLRIACYGIDVSDSGVNAARKAVHRIDAPASGAGLYLPGRSELLDCDFAAAEGMLERQFASALCVRDWLRENITWLAADVTDVDLLHQIGIQDIVMANNFMRLIDDSLAESCLRNVAHLVAPGGIIVVDGVDLDVKTRVLASLHFVPVIDRLAESGWSDMSEDPLAKDDMKQGAARPEQMDWRYRNSVVFRSPERSDETRGDHAGSSLSARSGLYAPGQL
ncbi:hypothetical protein BLJAPNOD_05230 [Ensifer sp. M14]|uniref:Chemotaxis protein methyltransferase n=1 Tax=Sinorhizobium sp. M14 TaxID=430451 RepID=A0A142BPL7_9HYPH|nr:MULTISPECIES: CheR family methyltransferase [Sinorhizobium/Ensifer group]AMP35025.1 Putative chemotaxis protein methyltransferase [Sinorhizobium sp. M14]RDL48003.1 hypothetical protein BLJAPNOD_05230 [Ensifer sp. M14]